MRKTVLAVALMFSSAAHAEFYTGNTLLEKLRGDGFDSAFAMGYVTGAHDASRGIHHCSPTGITIGQIKDIVKMHLENNPELRQLSADLHVGFALGKVWPCPKKTTGNKGA